MEQVSSEEPSIEQASGMRLWLVPLIVFIAVPTIIIVIVRALLGL
jgi:hypothetical protein